jgi:hypothetical protein
MTDWVGILRVRLLEMKRSKEYMDVLDVVCREGKEAKKVLMSYDNPNS